MTAAKKKITYKKVLAKKSSKSKQLKKSEASKPIIVQRSRLNKLNTRFNEPLKRQLASSRGRKLREFLESSAFGRAYMILALVVLLATTAFWALLGSKLHQSNTDQLVNSYLFQTPATLSGASFPDQHTFLLKWPLFYVVKLLGYTASSFAFITIEASLATVGLLAAIIYKIERRPLVYGTLCLALTSVLLLVPTQPYAGALLPVNMAMSTTRNLEYILYIAGLWLLIRANGFKNWRFASGIGLLGLLIASDKLFLALSIGGALLATVAYVLTRRWKIATMSLRWLIGSIVAAAVGFGLIALVVASNVTHIVGNGAGPYGVVNNTKDLALGITYAISGLATNLGVNPAFDAVELAQIPGKISHRLWSLNGISFFLNIGIVLYGLRACYGIVKISLHKVKAKNPKPVYSQHLALALIFTTIAAVGVFVSTKHYYAVDARYLGISLFAVFIAMASFGHKKRWNPIGLGALGILLVVSIVFGCFNATANYKDSSRVLAQTDRRNVLVAQAMNNHKVDTLLGDYWRVLPIKSKAGGTLPVTPLQDCTQARGVLSSQEWNKNLRIHSFAYLLSFDKSLTDFPQCNLKDIIAVYGHPNVSTLIAGTLSAPKEILLYYDGGIQPSAKPKAEVGLLATVVPVSLNDLPDSLCAGPSVMNIVAHEDDDLLFMNPDLLHTIKEGKCVRTIYVTAGDGGIDYKYWQSREQGSEAAYDSMLGKDYIWDQRIVKLDDTHFVVIATPRDNPNISLVFMRLPDGNLRGEGFRRSRHESLAHLWKGSVTTLHSVDGQSTYTSSELTKALTSLVRAFKPTEIRTQSNFTGTEFPDHSDHRAVSRYAAQVHGIYQKEQARNNVSVPIKFYLGYPVHELPENITPEDLAVKKAAFLAYSKFDAGVCRSELDCKHTLTYESYLTRQYVNPY